MRWLYHSKDKRSKNFIWRYSISFPSIWKWWTIQRAILFFFLNSVKYFYHHMDFCFNFALYPKNMNHHWNYYSSICNQIPSPVLLDNRISSLMWGMSFVGRINTDMLSPFFPCPIPQNERASNRPRIKTLNIKIRNKM